MTNVNLNLGGAIGGLFGAGLTALLLFSPDGDQKRFAKILIATVIGGALVGNFLWGRMAKGLRPPTVGSAPVAHRESKRGGEATGRSCAICGASLAGAAVGVTLCGPCRQQTG